MPNCQDFGVVSTPSPVSSDIQIIGVEPIQVQRNELGTTTSFTITIEQEESTDGKDGVDGKNATIQIGTVTSGDNPAVINSGTSTNAILDITLPKGQKGDPGQSIKGNDGVTPVISIGTVELDDSPSVTITGTTSNVVLNFKLVRGPIGIQGPKGVAKGILDYKIAVGNNTNTYINMGTFTQGTYADLGDGDPTAIRKLRIKGWVTVANMQNWTTLRLVSNTTGAYTYGTVLSQRVFHSEGELYVGQYEINRYVETTDRYIGFSFADNVGGTYSSDGAQYGDYGVEVFVLE